MLWLTQDATLVCDHGGRVGIAPTQTLVRIKDPTGAGEAQPAVAADLGLSERQSGHRHRPCLTTLVVKQGYSTFVTIGGRAVCLDTVTGLTDGSPPGTVNYRVVDPGQRLVAAGS
jgi:hypothetical protein